MVMEMEGVGLRGGLRGRRERGGEEEEAVKWTKTEGGNELCFDSRSVHVQGCTSHWPAFEFCTKQPCAMLPLVHLKHDSNRGLRALLIVAKFDLMPCPTWRVGLYEAVLAQFN
jgi:hypothetical protein